MQPMVLPRQPMVIIAAMFCALLSVPAIGDEALERALVAGEPSLAYRLRVENVDQNGFDDEATAVTGRIRLGYRSADYRGWAGYVELEDVHAFGGEAYAPENPGRPIVLDPEGSETNQAYVQYERSGLIVRGGRQRITLDNQRFVGNVGWRQNEQTYDAGALSWQPHAGLTLYYGFLENVHRVNFDNLGIDAHLVNASHTYDLATVTGYGYWLDFNDLFQDTRTVGLRVDGALPWREIRWLYTAEYARQADYQDSDDIGFDYGLLDVGAACRNVTFRVAQETLEGDGMKAFQTPLATLHAFNGWADKFITTPADGLVDRYVSVGTSLAGVNLLAVYHRFSAERGSEDYGDEWDISISRRFSPHLTGVVKYARYAADEFATDTDKIWIMADFSI